MRKGNRFISKMLVVFIILQIFIPINVFAGYKYPDLAAVNTITGKEIYPLQVINDFNTADQAAQWTAGTNTQSVNFVTTLLNSPGSPYEGTGALEVMIPQTVKCYDWRTIYREFATPIDLSDANFIASAVDIWGWKQDDFFIKMKLTSGTDTYEAISQLTSNKWNIIYFDIHNWANRNSIDKIEFSYVKNFDLEGVSPGDPGYDFWDGRLQLDFLCATKAANLDFASEGCTEGFTATGGTVNATGGSLQYGIGTPENTYLESAGLMLDASKRNYINLRMKNNTGAAKLKVSWITDQDQTWNGEKSMEFDITDASDFTDYSFGIASALWKDKIDKIRISPVAASANTMLDIDMVSFSFKNLDTYAYQGKVVSCKIDSGKTSITVNGSVKAEYLSSNAGSEVSVFELPSYVDEKTADYFSLTPLAASAANSTFSLNFNVNNESGYSRIYSKFVAVVKSGDQYTLLDTPKYVTNPEVLAANTYPYTPTKSIKGLQVQLPADAERLGVQNAAINIAYDQLLTVSNHGYASIPYEFEGKTYYFRKDTVSGLDNQIKSMTGNGMAVTAILIMYRNEIADPDSPNKDIIHPDSTPDGTVYAFNTTNDIGVSYYKAITSFLAERYSRADKAYGRIMGYIVGNEVGQNKVWNNMGPKLMDEYVKQYERTLRLTYNIVRSRCENARVYISLDHFWNMGNSPDSLWVYDNKAIVDTLNNMTKNGGDYSWSIAFHPYPEDLFNPRTWADKTATDDFNTYRITFKNLQVLTNYLQQANMTYNGSQRHVILSEQGFHSGANTPEDQEVQAAAYAYAYYKVKSLPGIDAFILHRHVDHAAEGGLNLGLWTNMPGQMCEAGEQKLIYNVFKNIDTVDSLNVTEFAKGVIGISDWMSAIPEFDPAKLENRPVQLTVPMGIISQITGEVSIKNFDTDINGWLATDNVSSVNLDTTGMAAGNGCLKGSVGGINLNDYKGVTGTFDTPLDLTSTPVIKASVKASGIGAGEKAEFMIRAYSGDKVSEGTVIADAEAWNDVAIDLTGWDGINSVDRIKVWARPVKSIAWTNGALSVDEVSRAASSVLKNMTVTLDHNEVVNVNDTLTIHVQNNGNQTVSGTVAITGVNGITLDKSSSEVSIAKGAQVNIGVTVTDINIASNQCGKLQVTFDGQNYVFVLTKLNYPDYTEDGGNLVFGDFENGYTDGWTIGSNTGLIASIINDNVTGANHGDYMLKCAKEPKVATSESKVVKTFKEPVDLSSYDKVTFELFGWGGTSSAYLAKIYLIPTVGDPLCYTKEISPDTWVTVSADISDFAGKDKIQAIEISYSGKDTAFYAGPWGGYFYIDNVRTSQAAKLTGITPDKTVETLALQGGEMQLVIRGDMSDNTVIDVSTAAKGTTYTGYNENIITVSADGLVIPKAAGTTEITVNNGDYTAKVEITVSEELPSVMYSFETGLEGWDKSDPGDTGISGVSSALSSGGTPKEGGIPGAQNGGRMLRVDMAGVSPEIPKMVGVKYETPLNLSKVKEIKYSIFSWGGVPGVPGPDGIAGTEDDIAASYKTIFRLTSTTGEIFEKVTTISPDSWVTVSVDLKGCTFRDRIASMEIGHVMGNAGIPAWSGKFFIDNITKITMPEDKPAKHKKM